MLELYDHVLSDRCYTVRRKPFDADDAQARAGITGPSFVDGEVEDGSECRGERGAGRTSFAAGVADARSRADAEAAARRRLQLVERAAVAHSEQPGGLDLQSASRSAARCHALPAV